MHDQANHLRRLVRQDGQLAPVRPSGRPKLVAVAGGKGGVGTTTVATNLAVALAEGGQRTLLVDADADRGDVAVLCRLEDRHTVADVLSARRTIVEAIQTGPSGIGVLPGIWANQSIADCWASAAARLIGPLTELGSHFDLVVIDVGDCLSRMARQFWQVADLVVLVTGVELASVMDAYGSIKVLTRPDNPTPICSLINKPQTGDAADEIHTRLARVCHRFLAVELADGGYLPADPDVRSCGEKREPFVTSLPHGTAAGRMRRLATLVVSRPLNVIKMNQTARLPLVA